MSCICRFFFFNDTATTEIYTLSHTTLFRSLGEAGVGAGQQARDVHGLVPHHLVLEVAVLPARVAVDVEDVDLRDRKSTRLNSSHANISYAVFCLKKKKRYRSSSLCSCDTGI